MFKRLKKRGFFFAAAQHPTPTILDFARSADCQTYTFSWTYDNFPGGSSDQRVTFNVLTASGSWNNIYSSAPYSSYRSMSLSYANLVGAPYYLYLGRAVSARYQVYSNGYGYQWSAFFARTSDPDFIKQRPGTMIDAPTMVQTTA